MSIAPSIAVPAPPSIRCRLYIALFCLLWSFAFVAGKIGVTDCPPLILLTARFSLAGILILGISALRRRWLVDVVARHRGVRGSRHRQQRALSGPRLYRAADRLGRPRRAGRQRQSGIHRVLAALFLQETLTWRKVAGLLLGVGGVGFIVWHRLSVGTDDWHGILFTLASLVSIAVGTILFKLLAPKGSLWIGNGIQISSRA